MREDDIKLVLWVRFFEAFPCWGVSMSPLNHMNLFINLIYLYIYFYTGGYPEKSGFYQAYSQNYEWGKLIEY